jgi:hypothetical protein
VPSRDAHATLLLSSWANATIRTASLCCRRNENSVDNNTHAATHIIRESGLSSRHLVKYVTHAGERVVLRQRVVADQRPRGASCFRRNDSAGRSVILDDKSHKNGEIQKSNIMKLLILVRRNCHEPC